jgi:hypothetical protein
MKSIIKKIPHITFLAIMIFTMNIMPFVVSAAPTDNVTGYAFSDMPNTSDEISDNENHYGGHGLGFINMSGDRYGVNLGTDGKFTGYAWSEFGGYVQFNPSGKPEGGAYVDASCLAGNTACPVRGWIRFVSASNDPQSGGWDGWVKMSDSTVWSNGVVLGAPDAGRNRQMSGYAWGDDVVGWVDFSKVKVMGDWCPNIPGYDPAVPAGMIIDVNGNCVFPPRTDGCKLVNDPLYNPDPLVGVDNSKCKCPNDDYNSVTKQCGTINPPKCPDGSVMPPSGICPGGEVDQCRNLDGFQNPVPAPYTQVIQSGVKNCYIYGCTDIRDTTHYNPRAEIDNGTCSICDANSPSWVEDTQSCPACNPTVPGYVDGKCGGV